MENICFYHNKSLILWKILSKMAEEVELRELDFWSWIGRITEKLTFMRLNVLDHREVTEDDYALLKAQYRLYFNGEYPLYETKPNIMAEKSVQTNLFSTECQTEVLKELNGISLDILNSEPIKLKKNDKRKI